MPRTRDLDRVRDVLGAYASRGTFSSFAELPSSGRVARFRFTWFRRVTFTVTFAPASRRLTFQDLLPAVAARSPLDRDLRAYVRAWESAALPDHRRVDRRKVTLAVVNRGGALSVVATLDSAHIEYGVRKTVNVVHEIFSDFLSDARFTAYQVEHLRLNPELG